MAVFNVPVRRRPLLGHSVYGERQYGPVVLEKVAVVMLKETRQHSTVRADSSGTRGYAEELVATAKLLFPSRSNVAEDDRIEIAGQVLRIASKMPRFDISGRIDHYEVEASIE